MISTILHLIVVPMLLVGSALEYFSWKRQQFKPGMSKQFFYGLLFLAGYHALLSIPALISGLDMHVAAYGYVMAMVPLFATLSFVTMIGMEMLEVNSGKISAAVVSLLTVGVLVTALQLFNLPAPYLVSGFIIWNADLLPALLTSLSVFFVTIVFVSVIIKGWPKNMEPLQKTRAVILNISFLVLAVSGLIYFPSQNLLQTKLSFASGMAGAVLLVLSLFIKKRGPALQKG